MTRPSHLSPNPFIEQFTGLLLDARHSPCLLKTSLLLLSSLSILSAFGLPPPLFLFLLLSQEEEQRKRKIFIPAAPFPQPWVAGEALTTVLYCISLIELPEENSTDQVA